VVDVHEQMLQQRVDSLIGMYKANPGEVGRTTLRSLSVMCDTMDGSAAELIGYTLVDRLLSSDLLCRSMDDIVALGEGASGIVFMIAAEFSIRHSDHPDLAIDELLRVSNAGECEHGDYFTAIVSREMARFEVQQQ
jgi:hypothetical protein